MLRVEPGSVSELNRVVPARGTVAIYIELEIYHDFYVGGIQLKNVQAGSRFIEDEAEDQLFSVSRFV
ncbi:MAG: hypothetical protein OXC80_06010 [Gammaproteobacteria bacterium]|nr:hypothetical protein [Gammaproteobacteria bacterium]